MLLLLLLPIILGQLRLLLTEVLLESSLIFARYRWLLLSEKVEGHCL